MFTSDTTAKLGASLRGLAFTTPGKDSSMPASGEFTLSSLGIVGPSVDVGVNAKADDESASIQVAPAIRRGIAVVQVLRPEELCLGLIGNTGTKFCIQPAYECNRRLIPYRLTSSRQRVLVSIFQTRRPDVLVNPT